MASEAASAERLIERRSAVAVLLAALLIATQGSRMGGGESLLGWLLWSLVVVVFILWGSGALKKRAIRSLVNDEGSAENRRRAIVCGFWVAMASAAICFALTFVKDQGPREAIQVIVTSAVAAALLHFGVNERRALRG